MEKSVTAESGLQLIARLYKRPSLLHLDDILFPGGPEPGDIVQISGQSSVGKSLLLLKLLTKLLLPKSYEGVDIWGLEVGVILINTDHDISILSLRSLMEQFICNVSLNNCNKEKAVLFKNPEEIEKIIVESLKSAGCGYQKKFEELSAAIKSAQPDVEIVSTNGRTGSFEVTINEVLVFSKLRTLAFPDFGSVVEVVNEVSNGMPPREILKQQSGSFCAIA